MKKISFALLLAAGCENQSTPMPDLAMSLVPAPPTLGAAIDRMGRPAINTALNNSFNPDDTTRNAAKDAYNAEANQANWSTLQINNKLVSTELAGNLAIIDALDGVCGNQLMANPDVGDAGVEYAQLPAVLVDDELYLDTSIAHCAPSGGLPNYLAVEARFLKLPVTSCGGRTPLDDTIDVTYTLLSGASLTDGIDADADPATPASLNQFPFLNAPN